ncbi:MAG: hypothetical protein WCC38_16715 [Pseudonocardiaceae bacterium]
MICMNGTVHVAGPDTRAFVATLRPGQIVTGLRFRPGCAYGPSVIRRILRFQLALRLTGQGLPFATVAARAGYADQAHLAREVRALGGVPLGQLVAADDRG